MFAATGAEDVASFQFFADAIRCPAFKEKPEDEADNLGLLLVDDRCTIRTFIVAEEALVRHADFTVSKTLALPPSDIFRNGTALFLCQR